MKREDQRLWSRVAATVRPLPGRTAPAVEEPETIAAPVGKPIFAAPKTPPKPRPPGPMAIEPGRRRRIVRERDGLDARLDLHGLDQDKARAALERFLVRAWEDGYRAALVITGKGTRGDGILRRHAPEWLAAPSLREIVAGVSEADRRHGGAGALYVALKRRPRE